jgi:hypothetical protein
VLTKLIQKFKRKDVENDRARGKNQTN